MLFRILTFFSIVTFSLQAYTVKTLSEAPRIYLVEGFLSHKECDYIMKKAKPQLKRSTVVDPNSSNGLDSSF